MEEFHLNKQENLEICMKYPPKPEQETMADSLRRLLETEKSSEIALIEEDKNQQQESERSVPGSISDTANSYKINKSISRSKRNRSPASDFNTVSSPEKKGKLVSDINDYDHNKPLETPDCVELLVDMIHEPTSTYYSYNHDHPKEKSLENEKLDTNIIDNNSNTTNTNNNQHQNQILIHRHRSRKTQIPKWEEGCTNILLELIFQERSFYMTRSPNDSMAQVYVRTDNKSAIRYLNDLADLVSTHDCGSFDEFVKDLSELLDDHMKNPVDGFKTEVHEEIIKWLQTKLSELAQYPVHLNGFEDDDDENAYDEFNDLEDSSYDSVESASNNGWMQECLELIETFMKDERAGYLLRPTSPNEQEDNYKVLYLECIRDNLKEERYELKKDFTDDLYVMFENHALTPPDGFNAIVHENIKKWFELEISRIFNSNFIFKE